MPNPMSKELKRSINSGLLSESKELRDIVIEDLKTKREGDKNAK